MNRAHAGVLALVAAVTGGCVTPAPPDVTGTATASQLETRVNQTRVYDTLDKPMTMRSVIATLQDLGFVIDNADVDLGTITATRLAKYTMRMTVTVQEKGEKQVSVRANARIGEENISDARTYQDFFTSLDKAMFLTQNKVD